MLLVKGKLVKAVKSYDKFLDGYPLSPFYESALEREFEIATAFLNGQKIPVLGIFRVNGHKEGTKVMERLADRAGDRPIAQRALVAVAKSYEAKGKFFEAYQSWSDVSSRWPTGQVGRDSLLGMARSLYSGYRGPKYDLKTLVSAQAYYQEFKQRYPEYAAQMDVDRILNGIEEQLAYKYYSIGEYYERTGSKQAANIYFQEVIDSWPKTAAAESASKKIGKL
jgi:outer membrane protein assembly factor BamD (BamD/ComL family)